MLSSPIDVVNGSRAGSSTENIDCSSSEEDYYCGSSDEESDAAEDSTAEPKMDCVLAVRTERRLFLPI